MDNQVVLLSVRDDADFLEVDLLVVAPGMLSSWLYSTDDQLLSLKLLLGQLEDLLEVLDEGVVSVESCLYLPQQSPEDFPLCAGGGVWQDHVLKPSVSLQVGIVDIELGISGDFAVIGKEWPCSVVYLTIYYHTRIEANLSLLFHRNAGKTDSVVDVPGILPEDLPVLIVVQQ